MRSLPKPLISALALLLRLGLGAVLLYAAVGKWPAPQAFAEDMANYRLLPAALVPAAAVAMLGVEVVLGLVLISGLWAEAAAVAVLLVMVLFTGAVASALFRGLKIECGCFGAGGSPATLWTLLRDVAFVGAAALYLLLVRRRGSGKLSP